MAWESSGLRFYFPESPWQKFYPLLPAASQMNTSVWRAPTLQRLDWHTPAHKAALQSLAGQGRAASWGLGRRLCSWVRDDVQGGQPQTF